MSPSPSLPGGDVLLLVEDEAGDVVLMKRALAKAQVRHEIHVASDGRQAIAYLAGEGEFADRSSHPIPSVVLLDLKLPFKSGLEVLAWIRSQPGLKRLRVVILTSSREIPDVNRAYDLGISSYMVKPVEHGRLVSMVASLHDFLLVHSERPELASSGIPQAGGA